MDISGNNKAHFRMIGPYFYRLSFLITLLAFFSSCTERAIEMKIDGATPPSFIITSDSAGLYFGIVEVAPTNQNKSLFHEESNANVKIWFIKPNDEASFFERMFSSELSKVSYGNVPQGYVQNFPDKTPPPTLEVGKIYEATIAPSHGNPCTIRFKLLNGTSQIVPIPDPNEVYGSNPP